MCWESFRPTPVEYLALTTGSPIFANKICKALYGKLTIALFHELFEK